MLFEGKSVLKQWAYGDLYLELKQLITSQEVDNLSLINQAKMPNVH